MNRIESIIRDTPDGNKEQMAHIIIDTERAYMPLGATITSGKHWLTMSVQAEQNATISVMWNDETTDDINVGSEWVDFQKSYDFEEGSQFLALSLPRGEYYVFHPKLEQGEEPTEYSLAPEDIYSNLVKDYYTKTETDAIITVTAGQIVERVSEVESDVNAVELRVSSAEQKITPEAIVSTVTTSGAWGEVTGELALKIGRDENNQIVSMLNASANTIHLKSNRFKLESDYLTIDEDGSMICKDLTIAPYDTWSADFTNDGLIFDGGQSSSGGMYAKYGIGSIDVYRYSFSSYNRLRLENSTFLAQVPSCKLELTTSGEAIITSSYQGDNSVTKIKGGAITTTSVNAKAVVLNDNGSDTPLTINVNGKAVQINDASGNPYVDMRAGTSSGQGMVVAGSSSGVVGVCRLYNSSGKYTEIKTNTSTSSNVSNLYLPTSGGTLAIASSDKRLKENLTDSEIDALDEISKIKTHSFRWKDSKKQWNVGYVADELKELDENYVLDGSGGTNADGSINPLCVNDFYISALQTKAIQELHAKIEALTKRIEELEAKNDK